MPFLLLFAFIANAWNNWNIWRLGEGVKMCQQSWGGSWGENLDLLLSGLQRSIDQPWWQPLDVQILQDGTAIKYFKQPKDETRRLIFWQSGRFRFFFKWRLWGTIWSLSLWRQWLGFLHLYSETVKLLSAQIRHALKRMSWLIGILIMAFYNPYITG